jgi:hypothetical protein
MYYLKVVLNVEFVPQICLNNISILFLLSTYLQNFEFVLLMLSSSVEIFYIRLLY